MKTFTRVLIAVLLVSTMIALAGCSKNKAAGTWVPSGALAGTMSLELKSDGTGTLTPGGAIKWTEDGSAVKIFQASQDPAKDSPTFTGTLSDDQKQLTVSSGGVISINATFTRKPE